VSESDAPSQPQNGGQDLGPGRSRDDDSVLAAVLGQLNNAPYRYVLRRTGFDRVTTEDICQQAALDLVLYWDDKGGLPEVRAHKVMWTILKRRLADHYRGLRAERARLTGYGRAEFDEEPDLYEILADPRAEGAFDRVLDDMVQVQIVADLLHRIPPRQREALVLIHVDQLDQAAATNALGITNRGLQELLDRGRCNLKANYARLSMREDSR
jgi:DNA-directed RNA polymerase specialized sigma24 family protein